MRALLLLLIPATALARPSLPAWKHVSAVTRCHVRVEPASDAEKTDLLVKARKQFHATEVTLSDLGDGVRQVDVPAVPGHPRKLSGPAARKLASDFLVANANMFGLAPKLDKIEPKDIEETADGGYTIAGAITRTFEGLTETGAYLVTIDSDGHVASAKLGPARVLPAVALCKTTVRPTDGKVVANLIGVKLEVHAIGRVLDGGTITAKSIRKRYPKVIQHGDTELARVIAVEVKSADPKLARVTWTFYVDGESSEVLEQHVDAPPDL